MNGPLYLGFDLSTQQLKGLVVDSSLKKIHEAKFDFDADSKGFNVNKGVLVNEAEREVFAPVAMWLQAIDTLLARLKDDGLDFSRIKGISGSGMQHGSVFWNADAEQLLGQLNPDISLQAQLDGAFAHPFSPNWQDASTQKECDEFDAALGSEAHLATATGSKAHHRFTGPQILRFQRKYPDKYIKTVRITLVSSWLATIFLGKFAPFDISDVCGMNLWDIKAGKWNEKLLELAAGPSGVEALRSKLGDVPEDGGSHLGSVSPYFVNRHGFNPDCTIVASTGDNPATILALPLRSNDAMVSLGTSTTFLMSTSEYKPDPSTHFFNSPTTAGLYMFMLCYKNGGLAREKVRNAINSSASLSDPNSWEEFDKHLLLTAPLAQEDASKPMHLGLYFPGPKSSPTSPLANGTFPTTRRPTPSNVRIRCPALPKLTPASSSNPNSSPSASARATSSPHPARTSLPSPAASTSSAADLATAPSPASPAKSSAAPRASSNSTSARTPAPWAPRTKLSGPSSATKPKARPSRS